MAFSKVGGLYIRSLAVQFCEEMIKQSGPVYFLGLFQCLLNDARFYQAFKYYTIFDAYNFFIYYPHVFTIKNSIVYLNIYPDLIPQPILDTPMQITSTPKVKRRNRKNKEVIKKTEASNVTTVSKNTFTKEIENIAQNFPSAASDHIKLKTVFSISFLLKCFSEVDHKCVLKVLLYVFKDVKTTFLKLSKADKKLFFKAAFQMMQPKAVETYKWDLYCGLKFSERVLLCTVYILLNKKERNFKDFADEILKKMSTISTTTGDLFKILKKSDLILIKNGTHLILKPSFDAANTIVESYSDFVSQIANDETLSVKDKANVSLPNTTTNSCQTKSPSEMEVTTVSENISVTDIVNTIQNFPSAVPLHVKLKTVFSISFLFHCFSKADHNYVLKVLLYVFKDVRTTFLKLSEKDKRLFFKATFQMMQSKSVEIHNWDSSHAIKFSDRVLLCSVYLLSNKRERMFEDFAKEIFKKMSTISSVTSDLFEILKNSNLICIKNSTCMNLKLLFNVVDSIVESYSDFSSQINDNEDQISNKSKENKSLLNTIEKGCETQSPSEIEIIAVIETMLKAPEMDEKKISQINDNATSISNQTEQKIPLPISMSNNCKKQPKNKCIEENSILDSEIDSIDEYLLKSLDWLFHKIKKYFRYVIFHHIIETYLLVFSNAYQYFWSLSVKDQSIFLEKCYYSMKTQYCETPNILSSNIDEDKIIAITYFVAKNRTMHYKHLVQNLKDVGLDDFISKEISSPWLRYFEGFRKYLKINKYGNVVLISPYSSLVKIINSTKRFMLDKVPSHSQNINEKPSLPKFSKVPFPISPSPIDHDECLVSNKNVNGILPQNLDSYSKSQYLGSTNQKRTFADIAVSEVSEKINTLAFKESYDIDKPCHTPSAKQSLCSSDFCTSNKEIATESENLQNEISDFATKKRKINRSSCYGY